ncbi:MAG: ABC transporter permease [Planctomycetales bacterium]|nr:ABC transporter permease [Planctomycetales bacterium]
MNGWKFAWQSLQQNARVNASIALGVVISTAVLVGALLVGDSVKASLRSLTLDRLGAIDQMLVSDHFFASDVAAEIEQREGFKQYFNSAAPVIFLPNVAAEKVDSNHKYRSPGVTLLGIDNSFWQQTQSSVQPTRSLSGQQVILNQSLAGQLHVKQGDLITLRLEQVTDVAADSPLADKQDRARSLVRLEVVQVLPDSGLAKFGISPSQQTSLNAFVSTDILQDALQQTDKINGVLVVGNDARRTSPDATLWLSSNLPISSDDATLTVKRIDLKHFDETQNEEAAGNSYISVSTEKMMFPETAQRAIQAAFPADQLQPVLAYLANSIHKVGVREAANRIPYSIACAIDSNQQIGPLLDESGQAIALAANQIVLNSWAANDLGVQLGDELEIEYFLPETAHGQTQTATTKLTLGAIVPIVEPETPYQRQRPAKYVVNRPWTNDPDLTPTVTGVTDQESIDDWDPPFPFDYGAIRKPKDEDYWDQYRTTPKAFVSLETGQKLWGSRFGQVTSFRLPWKGEDQFQQVQQVLARVVQENAAAFGFRIIPVKANGLAASSGTTPFNGLFLGFSMFIIASAIMLLALLFMLAVEQRATETGTLLAIGLSRPQVTSFYLKEGLLISLVGAILGVAFGVAYAAVMIYGLNTWWVDAVSTSFLRLHVTPTSTMVGAVCGVLVAMLTIWFALRALRHISVTRLMSGQTSDDSPTSVSVNLRRRKLVARFTAILAIALAATGFFLTAEAQAGAFFGCGACVLTSLLVRFGTLIRRAAVGTSRTVFSTGHVVVRNISRNPGRSTLTVGLMASACFLIVAISAFRLRPTDEGTGGFQLVAKSSHPIFVDLSSADVRQDEFGGDADVLDNVQVVSLRYQGGDDASCRNLYQSSQPQILGVTDQLVNRFDAEVAEGFQWAGAELVEGNNPWRLLSKRTATPDDQPIPVILDKNTAMYSLHLYGGIGEEFEIDYDLGQPVRFKVVALLSNSVLQGSLLVSEADLLHMFPRIGGYRFFLIDCPAESQSAVTELLEDRFSDQGFEATDSAAILSDLLAVQNTYLSTFQSLGGLGLLLGTLGITAVQLRNVWERRSELALLRATGFAARRIGGLILIEHLALLLFGLGIGVVAALLTVLPHMVAGGASVPWGTLAIIFGLIFLVGIATGQLAVRQAVRMPIVQQLRAD